MNILLLGVLCSAYYCVVFFKSSLPDTKHMEVCDNIANKISEDLPLDYIFSQYDMEISKVVAYGHKNNKTYHLSFYVNNMPKNVQIPQEINNYIVTSKELPSQHRYWIAIEEQKQDDEGFIRIRTGDFKSYFNWRFYIN